MNIAAGIALILLVASPPVELERAELMRLYGGSDPEGWLLSLYMSPERDSDFAKEILEAGVRFEQRKLPDSELFLVQASGQASPSGAGTSCREVALVKRGKDGWRVLARRTYCSGGRSMSLLSFAFHRAPDGAVLVEEESAVVTSIQLTQLRIDRGEFEPVLTWRYEVEEYSDCSWPASGWTSSTTLEVTQECPAESGTETVRTTVARWKWRKGKFVPAKVVPGSSDRPKRSE